jgi:hypothetical protein
MHVVLHTNQIEGGCEQGAKVLGGVGELVRQVSVSPCGIDEYASIRADAAAKKCPRLALDDALLPRLDVDRPLVLSARPVLWEQAGKVGGVQPYDGCRPAILEMTACSVMAKAALEELERLADDHGIARIERDAEALGSRHLRYVAVAQVQAKQLGVVPIREIDCARCPLPATWAQPIGRSRNVGGSAPIANGATRNASAARYFAIVQASVHEGRASARASGECTNICSPTIRMEYRATQRRRRPAGVCSRGGLSAAR